MHVCEVGSFYTIKGKLFLKISLNCFRMLFSIFFGFGRCLKSKIRDVVLYGYLGRDCLENL